MALKLSCPKCGDMCRADTEKEILEIAKEHAKEQHPEMELNEETIEELKSEIEKT